MNDTKKLLEDLCHNLEEDLNLIDGNSSNKVVLISDLKPSNYSLPAIHLGTTKTISDVVEDAWYVEIYLNSKCIFRQSYIPKKNEDLKVVEGMLLTRVLRNIFTFGIMSSKQQLEQLPTHE